MDNGKSVPNKYYTPTIKEFHEGFEYEIFEDFDVYPEKEWHKQVYGFRERNPESIAYVSEYCIESKTVRVKYLDEADIISLGMTYVRSDYKNPNRMYYFGGKNQHSLIWNFITGRCIITLRDDERKEDYTAYVGVILNKSELSWIIERLC